MTFVCATVVAQTVPVDYSYCGYKWSSQPIPRDIPVKSVIEISGSNMTDDASDDIQKEIDRVSQLPVDPETGLRGIVYLRGGIYCISKPLVISASGVVLRGEMRTTWERPEDGTLARLIPYTQIKYTGDERGAVIYIKGKDDLRVTDSLTWQDETLPLGSVSLHLGGSVSKGSELMIVRPSTKEWISAMGCDNFGGGKDLGYWGWHKGEIDVVWHRTVTDASAGSVTIDAPLSMMIDTKWGVPSVVAYQWPGRVENSGVENLIITTDSEYGKPLDENHAWDGVSIDNARDCWVRDVNFRDLAGSAVVIQRKAQRITVQDCKSLSPKSEIGGWRRRSFYVKGENSLVQRCYSEYGINDFVAGATAAGPMAFVQCDAQMSHGFSGSVGPWATAVLFDDVNIDGNDLRLANIGLEKYGTGWNAANSMAYQCTASGIYCDSPDSTSLNYVYGCWGQFAGTGNYDESNNHVKPWSLFAGLLQKRLGRDVSEQCRVLERNTGASSSPTIEEAIALDSVAYTTRLTMKEWIDQSPPYPLVKTKADVKLRNENPVFLLYNTAHSVVNGKLTHNGRLVVGGRHDTPWWNGRPRYSSYKKAKYALTRFIPGESGVGTTDIVDSVVTYMKRDGNILFNQNYGLWYDRRRDDHERIRRKDGDVWPPFYEQPFARSGEGVAWDGLSKYDLTKSNKWYYDRLRKFCKLSYSSGMLLLYQHYFQHNILEAGAHWVDCPWRAANNINGTTFPEPVPFAGDKRVFMAGRFYNVNDDVLRKLHKQYIRRNLEEFRYTPNVIHSIGEEYTGPYLFTKMWLQTIGEWQKETGKDVLVALCVNKDVQDSIMSNPELASVVDIINIEQWFYHDKGEYAPPGGVNMAPRQYMRKIRTGGARFEDVYRAVRECRDRWPDKAVCYYAQKYPQLGWASLMAGGSCAQVKINSTELLGDIVKMTDTYNEDGAYIMSGKDVGALIYSEKKNNNVTLHLTDGRYDIMSIDPETGDLGTARKVVVKGGKVAVNKGIYWLRR